MNNVNKTMPNGIDAGIVTWNTWRDYSNKGQRMAAVHLPSTGQVAFVDSDRGINGVTRDAMTDDSGSLEKFVMQEYDHGRYNEGLIYAADIWKGAMADTSDIILKMKGSAMNQLKDQSVMLYDRAKRDLDPVSPEGYALVMADPALQIQWQDELDSFFQGRIVDVRNALRDVGWEGKPRAVSLQKDEMAVTFKPMQVGAGANVVGGVWKLLRGDSQWYAIDEVADDLTKTPDGVAADIDEAMVKAATRLIENKLRQPQELTLAEFSEIATVEKLENHGRKWNVIFGANNSGFCDSPTKEGALREAHSNIVNNAIYSNGPDSSDFMDKAVFPPEKVLEDYPELKVKFADVFAMRDVQERTQGIVETVCEFINEHPEWWDDQLSSASDKTTRTKLESWVSAMASAVDPAKVKECLSTFVQVVQDGEIDWVDNSAEDCLENILFMQAQTILDPVLEIDSAKIGPVFSVGQRFGFKAGDDVVANGYRGTVAKVCDGQLTGMVEVRLPGGVACMSASFPDCFPAVTNGVEVVVEGRFSGLVEEVTNQFVVQNAGRGRLVAHETHRFGDAVPAVGEQGNVAYKFGKATWGIEVAKGQGNER